MESFAQYCAGDHSEDVTTANQQLRDAIERHKQATKRYEQSIALYHCHIRRLVECTDRNQLASEISKKILKLGGE